MADDEYVWRDQVLESDRAFALTCNYCELGRVSSSLRSCKAGVFPPAANPMLDERQICDLYMPIGCTFNDRHLRAHVALFDLCFEDASNDK